MALLGEVGRVLSWGQRSNRERRQEDGCEARDKASGSEAGWLATIRAREGLRVGKEGHRTCGFRDVSCENV